MEKPRLEVIRFEEADIITASGQELQLGNSYNTSYAEAKEGGATGYDDQGGSMWHGEWQQGADEGFFLQIRAPGFISDAAGYAWYYNGRWYCTHSYEANRIEPDLLSQFTTEYWYPSN